MDKIFKGTIILNKDFMEAKCHNNSFWLWKGIIKGRELLRKGIR